jgi:hypothetical protein
MGTLAGKWTDVVSRCTGGWTFLKRNIDFKSNSQLSRLLQRSNTVCFGSAGVQVNIQRELSTQSDKNTTEIDSKRPSATW